MSDETMRDDWIAIVGMACRFPGAPDVEAFWRNLCEGVDSVRTFSQEELRAAGVDEALLADPRYVPAAGHLDGLELFDAGFFGYSPAEAAAIDPQQRLFLETAWTAVEHAGYDPHREHGRTGVFAGSSMNKYFLFHLFQEAHQSLSGRGWDGEDLPVGVSPDSLPARTSYKLRLNGPSVGVQAACATSLVAVCLACESLCEYRCDVALAGGVSVELPSRIGYLYQEGGMLSPDGRCRSFDARAGGSVFGSGAGVVVLKRLDEALSDGDHVYAVVRGWAVNNDGGDRVGYSAPGVNGQAAVVTEAQENAMVEPRSIGYVEAHGSATRLGDPIEVAALTKAFRRATSDTGFCALGSVKTNVGHLDAAAGVAGLIKTALAVERGVIPPSLHFETPNPKIDFEGSPFVVSTTLAPWPLDGPRRAGVSSFGVGGTNAHVVLEQPPQLDGRREERARPVHLFPLSARSDGAVGAQEARLEQVLATTADEAADVAYTLAVGRPAFRHRLAVVRGASGAFVRSVRGVARDDTDSSVTFMFPGVGDEYVGAGLELYREEPVFAEELDRCAERLAPILGFDIRSLLYPETADGDRTAAGGAPDLKKMLGRVGEDESELALHRPAAAHPICFSLEYALARLLHAWGVEPVAMVGHSMGEYVAACVAGVLSIDDALEIVGRRAALIADLPEGAMVAVPLAEADVEPFVGNGVSLAAVNAPEVSVLAGDSEAIDAVESRLRDRDVVAQRVRTSHAFHSRVMEEVRGSLEALFAGVELRPPRIPYVSNVSGTWITDEEATDPRYWGEHLCRPVRFADAVRRIRQRHRSPILVEVGPGQTLCSLAAAAAEDSEIECIHTIDPRYDRGSADASVLAAVGRLWTAGVSIDWAAVYDGQPRRRVAAPTYPFERRRYWIERPSRPRAVVPTPLPEPPRPQEPIAAPPAPVAFRNAHPRTLETPYAAPRTETERVLAEAWADLLGIEAVGVHDAFVELGGHSLLALQLANRLWEKHRLELPLATLFEHQTVAAVAAALDGEGGSPPAAEEAPAAGEVEVDEPPGAFERLLHDQVARSIGRMPLRDERLRPGEVATVVPELLRVVRRDHGMPLYPNEILRHATVRGLAGYLEDEIARFGDLTGTAPSVLEPEAADEGVGGPAAFVLSSVRSGSTLLRVMLAGDPALFCPPELHLLGHRTMGERAGAEPSPDRDQGIRRALAELRGVDMDEAQAEIDATTHADLPTWEVVRRLADLAAPRLLVDKSPGYANDVRTLHRIERSFDEPRFVVLLRHPYAVVDSVVRNRFVRLMEGGEISPFDFGEFVWTRSYGNILDFVETLPPERYVLLRFEELVTRPREALEPVCSLLGIRFSDALLEPYEGRRMRDGLGDPNFLRHDRIDASLGEAWRRVRLPRPLGRAARELAEALGYEIPGAGRTASAAPAGTRGAAV